MWPQAQQQTDGIERQWYQIRTLSYLPKSGLRLDRQAPLARARCSPLIGTGRRPGYSDLLARIRKDRDSTADLVPNWYGICLNYLDDVISTDIADIIHGLCPIIFPGRSASYVRTPYKTYSCRPRSASSRPAATQPGQSSVRTTSLIRRDLQARRPGGCIGARPPAGKARRFRAPLAVEHDHGKTRGNTLGRQGIGVGSC